MVANALQISVTPQKKSGKKRSLVSSLETRNFATLLQTKKGKNTKESKKIQSQESLSALAVSMVPNPIQSTPAKQVKQKVLTQVASAKINQDKQNQTLLSDALKTNFSKKRTPKTLGELTKIAQQKKLNPNKIELEAPTREKPVKKAQVQKNEKSENPRPLVSQKLHPQVKHSVAKIEIPTESKELQAQAIQGPQQTNTPLQKSMQTIGLSELLKQDFLQDKEQNIETKEEFNQSGQKQEGVEIKKEVQFKIAQGKEAFQSFSSKLKEEIMNYKPPFTKLSMELDPQELGKLEIIIVKKGKELQVSVNAQNHHALQTFIQNQNEFKHSLSNVGFSHVELSFSQGENREDSHSQREQNKQKGNKNSLEPLKTQEVASMEIKMVQYA